MSFDTVAPVYRALEMVVFGNALQRARVACLDELTSPRVALLIGDGNGRFLAEFVRCFPECAVDCVDRSTAMLKLASRALPSRAHVRFIHADILQAELPRQRYDCVATHFVLDCFDEEELPRAISRIAALAGPDAQWLVSEFVLPLPRAARVLGRALVALMYAFFRVTTRISATRLPNYERLLAANGFEREKQQSFFFGIVTAELWRRA
jgi:ubiquinone/menaquinone biosynthesis C-methylase UbiE